jgi:hypothetical protein
MPSGKFYADVLAANTNVDTGAVPAGKVRTVSINLVNTGAAAAKSNIYISTGTSPTDADRIEPDVSIPAGCLYKLTGEVVGAGERVVLSADVATVTARISGFEETA